MPATIAACTGPAVREATLPTDRVWRIVPARLASWISIQAELHFVGRMAHRGCAICCAMSAAVWRR